MREMTASPPHKHQIHVLTAHCSLLTTHYSLSLFIYLNINTAHCLLLRRSWKKLAKLFLFLPILSLSIQFYDCPIKTKISSDVHYPGNFYKLSDNIIQLLGRSTDNLCMLELPGVWVILGEEGKCGSVQ